MDALDLFQRQSYINIETFRKNGEGVKTPVWFALDGGKLYVRTVADSGKVKRIRRNGRVNIAPCKMDGTPAGDWLPAQAHEITDPGTGARVDRLLDKKYGLMKKLFGLGDALQKRQYTVLEVALTDES